MQALEESEVVPHTCNPLYDRGCTPPGEDPPAGCTDCNDTDAWRDALEAYLGSAPVPDGMVVTLPPDLVIEETGEGAARTLRDFATQGTRLTAPPGLYYEY